MPARRPFNLFALFRLTRSGNLLILVLAQIFTAYFLVDKQLLFDWKLFVLSISTASIAAAGYIINDYYDIKIDLINKPTRVVIGKDITRRYALLYHSVLSIAGIVMGVFLGWRMGLVHTMSAFLLWWYSNNLKRQPFIGNFVVALLTGLSILSVNVAFYKTNILVLIYALFAFFMTLVREIIKDMEDLKGDNTFGCKTLPIVWGIRKTKQLIYVLMVLFAITVVLINSWFTQLPIYYFLIFLFVPLSLLLYWLIQADTRRDFYTLSQWSKFILLLGVISMAFID